MSNDNSIVITKLSGRADIAINRPERKNALVPATAEALHDAFADAESDPEVRCVVLHGAGGAFCSGIDLKDSGVGAEMGAAIGKVHDLLASMRTPTIAAVERYAINAGSGLALGCDLLVIGETSFLQISEASMGVLAPANVAWLTQKFSTATALRLTLSGERYPGAALPSLGVPAKVVADADVLTTAQEMADRVAGYPNDGAANMKASVVSTAAAAGDFESRIAAARGPQK
ncbi:enoyl-CoA hydratase/carnithine racemase [Antricoccus suffuscus]|uniref:Enoyl-CoA hydratase/carnithine racemase n=1 Tax=Antricoccus suffuscus TaxID=1629062 RepID=A0A2T1A5V3_9ACTN|nr:enoyl-CoA hydratase/isomerase family protein [Antricoccus suffuscus]PRZ43970.1 enoyl-CoA hydratase/carnithine racemase [Antricoccus suffuscus]